MMIMEGSKMSKTEYDLKAILCSAYDTPINCAILVEIRLSSNPDYHSIMQQTHASVQMPPRLVQVESWVIPVRFCFCCFFRKGESQREGGIDPDAGISHCANGMGEHLFQTHFDGKIYQ